MLRLIALASSLALAQSYITACPTSHFDVDDEVVEQHNIDGTMTPATTSFDGLEPHSCDQIAAIGPDGSLRGVSVTIENGAFSLGWLGE